MSLIFYNLPQPLKNVATSVVAFRKKRQKYGDFFLQYFQYLQSSSDIEQQDKAAEEQYSFLEKVRINSNYYEIPADLDIHKMPMIDKTAVLNNYQELTAEKPYIVFGSSGTSGQPIKIPYNIQSYQKEYAYWWYHRGFGGIRQGDKIATLMGHKIVDINQVSPPYWVINYPENQLIMSSYHLAPQNLPFYIEKLNDFKPRLIHGYPSSIFLLARHILDNNIQLQFRPKMIVAASETTLNYQRETIEKAFHSKLYIWYGNTEFCGHITECPHGKLHVQPYHSYVRIVGFDGKDVMPGQEGQIVATNFTNTAFPLINYNTKDVVRLSKDQSCSCGKGGMIVDYIVGRIEDYVLTPDGRRVGRLDHLFKAAKYVRNAQIEQDRLDHLIVRIEKEDGYTSTIEQIILKEARSRVGSQMTIDFEYVSEISKGANGKFKFIIQKLNQRDLHIA